MSHHQENAKSLSVALGCIVECVELDIDENKEVDVLHTHTYERGQELGYAEQG